MNDPVKELALRLVAEKPEQFKRKRFLGGDEVRDMVLDEVVAFESNSGGWIGCTAYLTRLARRDKRVWCDAIESLVLNSKPVPPDPVAIPRADAEGRK